MCSRRETSFSRESVGTESCIGTRYRQGGSEIHHEKHCIRSLDTMTGFSPHWTSSHCLDHLSFHYTMAGLLIEPIPFLWSQAHSGLQELNDLQTLRRGKGLGQRWWQGCVRPSCFPGRLQPGWGTPGGAGGPTGERGEGGASAAAGSGWWRQGRRGLGREEMDPVIL